MSNGRMLGKRENKRTETVVELLKLKDFSLRELCYYGLSIIVIYTHHPSLISFYKL
jgi:hypothetical protein